MILLDVYDAVLLWSGKIFQWIRLLLKIKKWGAVICCGLPKVISTWVEVSTSMNCISAVCWQTIQVTSIQITDPYFYNINIQDLCTRWFLQTTIIVICIKFFALRQFKCWMLEYAYTNMWYLLWSLTIHLSLDKFIDAFIYGCLWCSDAWQTVCIEKGTK